MKKYIIIIIVLLLSIKILPAQDVEGTRGSLNHIGIFVGPTFLTNVKEVGIAAKLYYEFSSSKVVGFGLASQAIIGEYFEYNIGAPVFYYPAEEITLWAVPGVAMMKSISYNKDVPGTYATNMEKTYSPNFFIGIGVGWNFDISMSNPSIYFTPTFQMDLINFNDIYLAVGFNIDFEFLILAGK